MRPLSGERAEVINHEGETNQNNTSNLVPRNMMLSDL